MDSGSSKTFKYCLFTKKHQKDRSTESGVYSKKKLFTAQIYDAENTEENASTPVELNLANKCKAKALKNLRNIINKKGVNSRPKWVRNKPR